jgi:hypothetical protein
LTNSLRTLLSRVKDIYQEEGLLVLIKRILAFLISPLLSEYGVFYVNQHALEVKDKASYLPKIPNVTQKMVETIEQLDELASKGYDLSPLDISQARYRLGKGAIANLVFVDHELGYRGWTALTKKAKKTFNRYPYKVDFKNGEFCSGDAWTYPKYRRQGLSYYAVNKAQPFLIGKGLNTYRGIVLADNTASIGQSTKHGDELVAKARYIRIFGLQFWSERPVKSTNGENN